MICFYQGMPPWMWFYFSLDYDQVWARWGGINEQGSHSCITAISPFISFWMLQTSQTLDSRIQRALLGATCLILLWSKVRTRDDFRVGLDWAFYANSRKFLIPAPEAGLRSWRPLGKGILVWYRMVLAMSRVLRRWRVVWWGTFGRSSVCN